MILAFLGLEHLLNLLLLTQNVASVVDRVLSANVRDWKEAAGNDDANDTDGKPSAKAINPASLLCLSIDKLASSSLKDPNMTQGTIIKDNIGMN